MTAQALARRPAPRFAVRQYRRIRTAHPVTVLRWLRNGVLLSVAATAAVSLGIALQAGNDIGTARSTQQAVAEIAKAREAATTASNDLTYTLRHEDSTLTGTGSAYVNQLTQVFADLTVVAEDNAAGTVETGKIQFVENLLAGYLQQSEMAITDYTRSPTLGQAGETYATEAEGSLDSALTDLRHAERSALAAQRGTWALDPGPGGFWWALATPFLIMLLLVVATARVLARHFRRLVSGWLFGAVGVTALAAAVLGYLNARDAASLSANPWAGHPATLTCAMLLFTGAAALAYGAYRPRLAEYVFRTAWQSGEGPS
ncbi:MAG: hypothetical protein ACRDOI_10850 [Trebonia sp.]